jgi:acyl-CoA hydrolase
MQDQQQRRSLGFRFLDEPTDVNFGGKVHGSVVMKQMSQTCET